MALLFSYGTLQFEDVQLSTFGRLLGGQPDELPAFEPSLVPIATPLVVPGDGKTQHANAAFTGNEHDRVVGATFELTDAELAMADRYEQVADYVRVIVTLASGREAWVYVDSASAPGHS